MLAFPLNSTLPDTLHMLLDLCWSNIPMSPKPIFTEPVGRVGIRTLPESFISNTRCDTKTGNKIAWRSGKYLKLKMIVLGIPRIYKNIFCNFDIVPPPPLSLSVKQMFNFNQISDTWRGDSVASMEFEGLHKQVCCHFV